ncbi:hypothetical protein AAFF_G00386050 [Aldrovandia affinis]|uniref:protein-tyrosine-phosphatase n=1 Tax=Aldrovandia affinis TaxID=143900 RepID=A0AAD7SF97_9TELE|nr:hypothetical protein AAFF_G00386050 [Aldrovandia affinis]
MSIGVEAEFSEIEAGHWNVFYQEVHLLSSNMSFQHSKRPENRSRNRYRDVSPFDHSRVSLQSGKNDYINANLILMEEVNRRYILTQGPLPSTCGHFWQMVWEQRSRGVVMLSRLIELNSVKCSQYWPPSEVLELAFDTGFRVTLLSEAVKPHCTVRRLGLENVQTRTSREILHFHYTTWPESGVPDAPDSFLSFLSTVRESGCLVQDQGPVVVHCSGGIGRSGVFCLVDTCLLLMRTRKDPSSVCVRDVLLEMRRYRMGLIQTAHQLRFSYIAIIEGAKTLPRDPSIQESTNDLSDEEDSGPMFTPPLSPTSTPPPPRPLKRIGKTSEFYTLRDAEGEVTTVHDRSCSPDPGLCVTARRCRICAPPLEPSVPAPHRQSPSSPGLSFRIDGDLERTEAPRSLLASLYVCATVAMGAYICYHAKFH